MNEMLDISTLTEQECDLLIEELLSLDPDLPKKVKFVSMKSEVTKQVALEYVINETVQLWAKVHLNWTARDYQIPILEYGKTSKRLVLRLGRRLGKCVTDDTEIIDANTGCAISIRELVKRNDTSVTPCSLSSSLHISEDKKFAISNNGIEDVYRLKTTCGYEVKATSNHPFLTVTGWKELGELSEGDYIATVDKLDITPNAKNVPIHDLKFLGYMIGDGSTVDRLYFHNQNKFIVNEMQEVVEHYNCTLKTYNNRSKDNYVIISNNKKSNEAIQVINRYGLRGRYSHNKRVPKAIFSLSTDKIAIFLNRLFSTDGNIASVVEGRKKQSLNISYSSTSKQLIKDIRLLLLRFGIKCYINKYKSLTPDKKPGRDMYVLNIKKLESMKIFLTEIGFVRDKEKQESLLAYCEPRTNGNQDKVSSDILTYIENICTLRQISYKELLLCCGVRLEHFRHKPQTIRKSVLKAIADTLEDSYLTALANSNIYWDKIKKIEHLGEEDTYDLSVEDNKNYICGDGIVSHNTEDMCILILWHAFRQPNKRTDGTADAYEILILTPFETQVDLIFDRLKQLINGSSTLSSMVSRSVQHRYEWDNGSIIKGLTVGSSSGKEGANTRGQASSRKYCPLVNVPK